MQNEAMPEGREYVVVTRAEMKSGRTMTHVYGPYGQAKAKSVKSNIRNRWNNEGQTYALEVSVCHVLDPDAWNSPEPYRR